MYRDSILSIKLSDKDFCVNNSSAILRYSLLFFSLLLTGCATTHSTVNDPFEGYNRTVHGFNDTVDSYILKPISQSYDTVLPSPARRGVSNFFSNLDDITVIINDILQLKLMQALEDTGRFALNSTLGIAGLIDVASEFGLYKNHEDFGQTLGYWGVESGPYLVLPFLGPSSLRDTVGLIGDYYTDPITYVEGPDARNPFVITRIVDNRANLLKAEKVLEAASFDEYSYIRDAYLQRRKSLVYDGQPPEEDFDLFDE